MRVLLLILLLAAPTLAQVTPPAQFRGSLDQGKSIGDLNWWEVFQDPALQKLIETALAHNPDLLTAVTRVDVARANAGLVGSAQYPNVGLQADWNTTQQSAQSPNFVPGFLPRSRSFGEILLNLFSFELDIWGRVHHQVAAADAEVEASDEDRKAVMTVVVSDVAAGYLNLLDFDSELGIAEKTLETRQDSLEIIRAREAGGVATLLDVREAEQLVQTANATISDTHRLIDQGENNLNLLLGNSPGPIERGQALTAQRVLPQVPAGLPSELLLRRPDIRSAERSILANQELLKSARAAYFPQISLTSFLGFQSQSLATFFRGTSTAFSAVPQLTLPIFDAGKLQSQELQAQANDALALINYQKVVYGAFRDVSNALVQYQRVREIRGQEEQLVTTLEDRKRLAYLRYQGGVDTLLNALDADRDLLRAEVALSQARRDELLSVVQLYRALGGGWQSAKCGPA